MAKILAVDDQEDNLDLLGQILEENEYEVFLARNGKEALDVAEREIPDVILLDIHMPEMDGYEACKCLKEKNATNDIPVIFLTANTAEESVVKGLDLGAYDYVTKPFNEKELLARIGVMVRIRASEKKVEQMAVTDTLTGLHNRRYLQQRFGEEIARAKRDKTPLACLMLDIDFFKKVNDTHGHDMGDFILKGVAELLKKQLREYDAVVRFGGEEFFMLLPGTNQEQAVMIAERIREAVGKNIFEKGNVSLSVTVSIGVSTAQGDTVVDDQETYIKSADEALYEAKQAGRNQVVVFNAAG